MVHCVMPVMLLLCDAFVLLFLFPSSFIGRTLVQVYPAYLCPVDTFFFFLAIVCLFALHDVSQINVI